MLLHFSQKPSKLFTELLSDDLKQQAEAFAVDNGKGNVFFDEDGEGNYDDVGHAEEQVHSLPHYHQ